MDEIKETQEMATELQKCNVETTDVVEMAVITAIKNGFNTKETIQEETTIKDAFLDNILETLISKNKIICVPGAECDTYMLKVSEQSSGKKYRFAGCLLLPVSTFRRDGKRYVTRGKWYEIPEDCDIMNDIEWYEDTDEVNQMKTVMKMVSETNKKSSAKSINNTMKNAGEAPDEIKKYIGTWVNLTDQIKINIEKGGSEQSAVFISPRFIDEQGREFPWGTLCPRLMNNSDILDFINNNKFNEKIELESLVHNFKRIRAFKSVNGLDFVYADITDKKGNITITDKSINLDTKKEKTLGTKTVSGYDDLLNIIKTEYTLYVDVINKHNENVQ